MSGYVNINNSKKKVTGIYCNVNGLKKKVISAYANKDGVAAKIWSSGNPKIWIVPDSRGLYILRKTSLSSYSQYKELVLSGAFGDCVYSNGRFVASKESGESYMSYDGVNWVTLDGVTIDSSNTSVQLLSDGYGVMLRVSSSLYYLEPNSTTFSTIDISNIIDGLFYTEYGGHYTVNAESNIIMLFATGKGDYTNYHGIVKFEKGAPSIEKDFEYGYMANYAFAYNSSENLYYIISAASYRKVYNPVTKEYSTSNVIVSGTAACWLNDDLVIGRYAKDISMYIDGDISTVTRYTMSSAFVSPYLRSKNVDNKYIALYDRTQVFVYDTETNSGNVYSFKGCPARGEVLV